MFNWNIKEAPFFTGIARGVGGAGWQRHGRFLCQYLCGMGGGGGEALEEGGSGFANSYSAGGIHFTYTRGCERDSFMPYILMY